MPYCDECEHIKEVLSGRDFSLSRCSNPLADKDAMLKNDTGVKPCKYFKRRGDSDRDQMYPELKKSYLPKKYRIVTIMPPKQNETDIYSLYGEHLKTKYQMAYTYTIEDLQKIRYTLQSGNWGFKTGDIVEIYYFNGEFQINKVDLNDSREIQENHNATLRT